METEIKGNTKIKTLNLEEVNKLFLPGEVGAVLEWTVSDPAKLDPETGLPFVTEHKVKKAESFVRQFLDMLWAQANLKYVNNPYNIRDTSNTLRTMISSGQNFNATAGAGVVTYGIIVGTGVVAPTISDYVLGTPIANGVGAGQLSYGGVTFGPPTSDSTTSQFTVTRNFANASGAGITVTELGLYITSYDSGSTQRFFMIIRDVIGGGILIPNGQTLTVNYRPQCII